MSAPLPSRENTRIAVISLGYVGLPLAVAFGRQVDIHDPWVSASEAKEEYGVELVEQPEAGEYDTVIPAVSHREFIALAVRAFAPSANPMRSCST